MHRVREARFMAKGDLMRQRAVNADPGRWVGGIIKDFISLSAENTLKNEANDKAWAEPLVGFSSGTDPLYQEYKEKYIGGFHWTPLEVFRLAFPGTKVHGTDLTVISWILPQTGKTKSDVRKERLWPSESWARARIFGEEVNVKLRRHVVDKLRLAGIDAVAPVIFHQWETKISGRYNFASTWSERHAAYAAGLGTFGLCDGLITPAGKAMRCGSVIAGIKIAPTPRPYKDYRAYCLFYSRGTCRKCMDRCPAGALSEAGHDKDKCLAYLKKTAEYVRSKFGFEGYGCGMCQTSVPCESKIPG